MLAAGAASFPAELGMVLGGFTSPKADQIQGGPHTVRRTGWGKTIPDPGTIALFFLGKHR